MNEIQLFGKSKVSLAFLIVLVILGVFITRDYGESWDERQFFKYAERALEAYSTWPTTGHIPITGNTYDNYGPAYVMLVTLSARLLGWVLPWMTSDLRHLIYFATFVVGIWVFGGLCERWLSRRAAIGATLLFATQPLFWGHAFISPKDIPFMVFFMLSLLLGLRMVDSVYGISFDSVSPQTRRTGWLLGSAWLVATLVLLSATALVHNWIDSSVMAAATGKTNLVSKIATDISTANAQLYIDKLFVLFLRARTAFILLSALGVFLNLRQVPIAIHLVLTAIPAAIVLGFTTSIRILGPFAGSLVALYAFWKMRRKALPVMVTYSVVAAAVMYATWPYLWADPPGHLLESIQVMARYPWRGEVLFDGAMYESTGLPRSYLPVLLGIQLTEPVWLLFIIGITVAVYETLKQHAGRRNFLLLTLLWFVLPLAGFVIERAPLYDNFRQVIFILPPVFMMAGVAMEKLRRLRVQAVVIALVILPGIVDGFQLHPYEYIYYNRFVGGVFGAFRVYELDYWGTSFREAADYLNGTAPANASIWVEGPTHLLQAYSRPDLKVYSTYEAERADHYDYVVALSRFDRDLKSYPDAGVTHVIERQGALLTVIKKP